MRSGDYWRRAGVGALLAMLTAVSYASYLGAPFLHDDLHTIRDNPALRDHLSPIYFFTHPRSASKFPATMTRPLLTFSYALDYHLFGPNPDAFRAVNWIIHLANAFMIYLLTRRARGLSGIAAWAGALFAVMPLHASAIGLVSNRSTLLFSAFYLAAMIVFARACDRPGQGARALAALATLYTAALLCKEAAATLPAALVLWGIMLGPANREARRFTWSAAGALAVVLIAFLAYRRVMAAPVLFPEARPWPVWRYAAAQAPVFWDYVRMMFLPMHLSMEHDAWVPAGPRELISARFLFAAAAIVALAAGAWHWRKRAPAPAFAALFAVVYLLPMSSIVPLTVLVNENRPYLASLVMIWTVLSIAPERRFQRVILGASVVLFLMITAARGQVFRSELGAWNNAVRIGPGQARAWVNLGAVYSSYGRYERARACYERAVGLDHCSAVALTNLGNLAQRASDLTPAEAYYRRALDCDHGYQPAAEALEELLKSKRPD